ncbi:MAG: EamA family transporter [Rhizobiaceae bacterium]|nr:EamA family transporter [Rhizobiaceae bacterium]
MISAVTGFFSTIDNATMALWLTLLSAFSHAVFGAINKSGFDPYLNRGAINICYSLMMMPVVVFVVPLPTAPIFAILAVSYFLHLIYEWLQAAAYVKGDFTLVYPIVRGTSPVVSAFIAAMLFTEQLGPSQWFGLLLLSGGIFSLAWVNIRLKKLDADANKTLVLIIGIAVLTGVMVALFTNLDAYGIRLSGEPFTFLAWFFFLGGFGFPLVALHRMRKMAVTPPISKLAIRGVIGALFAFSSFGCLMLATWYGSVAEAAALRETSIIFATIIGVLIFKEKLDLTRLTIIGVIVTGAVLVKFTW